RIRRSWRLFRSLLVKEAHHPRAVMLGNHVHHRTWKPVLRPKRQPVSHVRGDDSSTGLRAQAVMRADTLRRVLNEEVRPLKLADIVVVGTDAYEKCICTDFLRC